MSIHSTAHKLGTKKESFLVLVFQIHKFAHSAIYIKQNLCKMKSVKKFIEENDTV